MRRLIKLASAVKRLKIECGFDYKPAWAGTFGETKDGVPYIGVHPRHPHAYFALGYGGNGLTFSVIAAEIIREFFMGHANPHARIFRFGR